MELYAESSSSASPIAIEINNQTSIAWTFEVEGINIPHDNYPFAFVISSKNSTKEIQSVMLTLDADNDGHKNLFDCHPYDSTIYPGAREMHDKIDNNCNELIDEGFDNSAPVSESIYLESPVNESILIQLDAEDEIGGSGLKEIFFRINKDSFKQGREILLETSGTYEIE